MEETIPIYIHSNHGIFKFSGEENETLGSAIKRAGIPISSVTTYLAYNNSSKLSDSPLYFISASHLLKDFKKSDSQIIVRLARNISLPSLLNSSKSYIKKAEDPITEWVFPDKKLGSFKRILAQLSSKDCFNIVAESVKEVLSNLPEGNNKRMVIGVSGGGDSNVMLSTIINSGIIERKNIIPVMMLGIPDWDRQKNQAIKLCDNLGLKLKIVTAEEVAEIISVSSLSSFIQGFKKEFPDVDLEFLGTFLLRKILSYCAKENKADYVLIGANKEDIISEGIARISKGLLPLPAPFREIGDVIFVYPMWKVPKKIGDGAFPRYSLINYENRNPSYSEGRCLFYYIAYMLVDICPGLDTTLLDGFSKLSKKGKNLIIKDKGIDDFICNETFDEKQIKKWKKLFQK